VTARRRRGEFDRHSFSDRKRTVPQYYGEQMMETQNTSRGRGLAGVLFSLGLLIPQAVTGQHFPPNQDLELMLRYLVEDAQIPGIVLGVLEADGSTRIVSYGSGGPGTHPLGPRSIFEVGSITKTLTASLLADAVSRGEVALADPVSRYLPDNVTVPSYDGRQITLEDLATHRSGLPDWADHSPADPRAPMADYDVETLYDFLTAFSLTRPPGREYQYSNLGFQLLGIALSGAAGMPISQLVHQRILEPLGMEMTGYLLEGDMAEWMTRGHGASEVVPPSAGTEGRWGAGGLRSNMDDMLKYLKANVGPHETPLQAAMYSAHAARAATGEERIEIGLGWQILKSPGQMIVVHLGRAGGFRAGMGFDPQRGIGTVLLSNDDSFTDLVWADLLRFVRPPSSWEKDVPTSVLEDYAGVYESDSNSSVFLRLEKEGWLTYQVPGRVRARLYARSDTSFFLMRVPWTLTFQKTEAGGVTGIRMGVDERELRERAGENSFRRVNKEVPSPRVIAAGHVSSLAVPWRLGAGLLAGIAVLFVVVILGTRFATAKNSARE